MSSRDLQPDRRPEAAPQQLLLQRLQEVLGVVLLDLQVLVAGDPEGVVLEHLHAGEQLVEVRGDDVLEGHEPPAVPSSPSTGSSRGSSGGTLTRAKCSLPGARVAEDDGEVERQPGDVREGVRGVDRERGEHREDLVAEEGVQPLLLRRGQLAPSGRR